MRTTLNHLQKWARALAVIAAITIASVSCSTNAPEPSSIVIPTWTERASHMTAVDGISLAWHALALAEHDTFVVYSLASDNPDVDAVDLAPINAQLRFKAGAASPMIEATKIDTWGDVSLGIIRFPGPPADAEMLQLEVADVRAGDVMLPGSWQLEMLYNSRPGTDSLTMWRTWPANGIVVQGSLDITATTGRFQPDEKHSAEVDDTSSTGPMATGSSTQAKPTSTPVPIPANPVRTLTVQGVDRDSGELYATTVEIDNDGAVFVDTGVTAYFPDIQPEPLSDVEEGAPTEHVSLEEALARSPVAIWSRVNLANDVNLEKVSVTTFAQPDDMVALAYSDGVQIAQYAVPPGTDMRDNLAISESIVTVRIFDLHGLAASGFGAGVTKSPFTGEDVPYLGSVWWERDGVFHSITGDMSFEALIDIARDLRPAGE